MNEALLAAILGAIVEMRCAVSRHGRKITVIGKNCENPKVRAHFVPIALVVLSCGLAGGCWLRESVNRKETVHTPTAAGGWHEVTEEKGSSNTTIDMPTIVSSGTDYTTMGIGGLVGAAVSAVAGAVINKRKKKEI